jgi:cytidylate kinase
MRSYFVFSGSIGSGKSTISRLFAVAMNADWSGFGATVREIAVERRIPITRGTLQELGAELVARERTSFCARVMREAHEGGRNVLVIDGLRHIDVLTEIRSLAGENSLFCVYLETPQLVRLERIGARDGLLPVDLAELERHSTEIEVANKIREFASFVANNGGSADECVSQIVNWARHVLSG